jgi:hypothetical protein
MTYDEKVLIENVYVAQALRLALKHSVLLAAYKNENGLRVENRARFETSVSQLIDQIDFDAREYIANLEQERIARGCR